MSECQHDVSHPDSTIRIVGRDAQCHICGGEWQSYWTAPVVTQTLWAKFKAWFKRSRARGNDEDRYV